MMVRPSDFVSQSSGCEVLSWLLRGLLTSCNPGWWWFTRWCFDRFEVSEPCRPSDLWNGEPLEKLRRLGFWELEYILGSGDNWLWDTSKGGYSKNKPMTVHLLVLYTPVFGEIRTVGSFGYQCSLEQSFMHFSLLLMSD